MKSVIITGSTRGIGKGLAENFIKQQCQVVITGRKQDDVDVIVKQLSEKYPASKVTGIACDVTKYEQLQSLWQHGVETFGQVDIWINNAGINIPRKSLEEQVPQDIINIVNTNITGLLLANNVALAGMKKQDHGQIWNMEGFGSNGATQPGMTVYGATKRAVNYLIKSLQKEIKDTNVQVNTLSPGIVVTDLLIGDYDLTAPEWQKTKKIFNILGDKVETVTPWLVNGILKADKSGATVAWLTGGKAFRRFMGAAFNKRDLFADIEGA